MRHHIFEESNVYPIAILVKGSSFTKQELVNNYVTPLAALGIPSKDVIAFTLKYNDLGKAPASFIKEYLTNLLPALDSLGVKHLYVADANYFKVLAGQVKADLHFGYVFPCKVKGFEHMTVVLGLNYQVLIFNPSLVSKLELSLKTLASGTNGSYTALGSGIIHSAHYPRGTQGIAEALESLHQYPRLAADIEAFSLRFNEAGIGTISFAWDDHNGLAFACDYANMAEQGDGMYGTSIPNPVVRALLLKFFTEYKGQITWHNAAYDVKVIVYSLWMQDLLDTAGLLKGLDIMTRSFHDTKIIAYLAVNSTAGNVLGLKALAQEFAGNWAVEVKDIRRVPLDKLLQYNLVDALATNYVREKYYPVMVEDSQEGLYYDLMLPSLKLIIQIELSGMPMSAHKVQEVKGKLEEVQKSHLDVIMTSSVVKDMELLLQTNAMQAANSKLKVKQHPLSKFSGVVFNPNSGPQLQILLYERMGLPVIDTTETKMPATGADTIEKMIHHTQVPAYKEVLAALIGYGKATKILSTFIPAFERGISKADGCTYLHGSFNLGGTVSGRLSSSDPNMQNLPSGSEFGKTIKKCFSAPTGWLLCGADFSSLEDRINALLTKDPEKLKVYTDGYDSHSLRSFAYFGSQMATIKQVDAKQQLRTFKVSIDGQEHFLMEGDELKLPDGTIRKVESLC